MLLMYFFFGKAFNILWIFEQLLLKISYQSPTLLIFQRRKKKQLIILDIKLHVLKKN